MKNNKPLGRWALTSLVVGNMIGSGIFLLPANLAKIGSISILGFILTALGTVCLAIILSKLSILIPKNGGPFVYTEQGLGGFAGFQTIYNHWIAMWVAIISIIINLTMFISEIWPTFSTPIANLLISLTVVLLLTLINFFGPIGTSRFQFFTTILKLIPLLLIPLVGIWYFHPAYIIENFNLTFQTYTSAINDAAAITLWAFIGVESAVIPYDLVENPQRDIPFATIGGTIIAAIIYIFSATIIIGMLPATTLATSSFPFAKAAIIIFGETGKWIASITAIISCIGSAAGWMFIQNRLAKAGAEYDLFPKIFAKCNKRDVPLFSLIVSAIMISIILLLTLKKDAQPHLQILMAMASMAALIPYIYSAISATSIFKDNFVNSKVFPSIILITIIFTLWAITSIGQNAVYYGSILLFISAILFGFGYRKK